MTRGVIAHVSREIADHPQVVPRGVDVGELAVPVAVHHLPRPVGGDVALRRVEGAVGGVDGVAEAGMGAPRDGEGGLGRRVAADERVVGGIFAYRGERATGVVCKSFVGGNIRWVDELGYS